MYRGPGPGRGARKAGEALAGRRAARASPGVLGGVADAVVTGVAGAAADAAAEAVAQGALREGNSSRHRVICHTRVVKFPSSVVGEDTQNKYDSPTSPGARHEAFDDRRPLDGTPAGRPGA